MHQIQQHILSIDCSSQPLGREVQRVVGDLMEKEFYPKLELLLNQYPLTNATWVLQSVEINLPPLSKRIGKRAGCQCLKRS